MSAWRQDPWGEERVSTLIDHYEMQSEDEAVAEDEAARADPEQTVMVIVITKNGPPISRLVPYRDTSRLWFGRDRDIIQLKGPPMPPEWYAKSEDSEELS